MYVVCENNSCEGANKRTDPPKVLSCFVLPSLAFVQTGQPMVQLSLVPNLNLRRLIKDLLHEGGEGLYVHQVDTDDEDGQRHSRGREGHADGRRDYKFALVAEQILVFKVRYRIAHDAFLASV